jgi:hypothetical protein
MSDVVFIVVCCVYYQEGRRFNDIRDLVTFILPSSRETTTTFPTVPGTVRRILIFSLRSADKDTLLL